jgi:peptide-methionine (S)-S-oxide reductase
MEKSEKKLETATLAAGCFWGVEDAFANLPGVVETAVGYAGGDFPDPTYEDVLTHTTGHAEAVEVKFDPQVLGYENLLKVFWSIHDPTTSNRQGPDVGSNYRSVIFYHNDNQKELAEKSKMEVDKSGMFKNPIVTEIIPVKKFWRAEEYHQKYFTKHGGGACHFFLKK